MKEARLHRLALRVYYEDTDFSGAVYHASYLRFMERGRTEMLRSCGLNQGALMAGQEGEAYGFVVRDMQISFLKPARHVTIACVARGKPLRLPQAVRKALSQS